MNTGTKEVRGAWGVRLLIRVGAVIFGILFFWLLGFIVMDIESMPGPDYYEIERQYISAELLDKKSRLKAQIADAGRDIERKQERRRLAGDSSQNLQRTVEQLAEMRRLGDERQAALSEEERDALAESLAHFLSSQEKYQQLNDELFALAAERQELEDQLRVLERDIDEQQKPAREKYDSLSASHRLWLAVYQLALLLPLLLVVGYLLVSRHGGVYYPLLLAVGGATLFKVALVLHSYFPSRYFKYLLIVALLAVVARLMVYLIRTIAFPKREWLARQYRDAYERFLCPVCGYPIRTGPRKYLYWTRRTVHKIMPRGGQIDDERPYTCPACGTRLFESCATCGKVRHSLLPNCAHCGSGEDQTPSSQ